MKELALFSLLVPDLLTENEYLCLGKVVGSHHGHLPLPHQCSSLVVQRIDAPAALVWSVVRRFDNPQLYKHFLRSCEIIAGDGDVGSIREVTIISGLPAINSTERLEILDEANCVLSFSILGGEHRLQNYRSTTSVSESCEEGRVRTVVVESYVVDIPDGSSRADTHVFVDAVIKSNLQSLAHLSERLALK